VVGLTLLPPGDRRAPICRSALADALLVGDYACDCRPPLEVLWDRTGKNTEVVRTLFATVSAGNYDDMTELFAQDIEFDTPLRPTITPCMWWGVAR
jgi:hypothetical protein